MGHKVQEARCDHAQLTRLTELAATDEAIKLFREYQAAFIPGAVKRCGYQGFKKPTTLIFEGVNLVSHKAAHEHKQVMLIPLLLCSDGIGGCVCPAKQGPSQMNEHVGDQGEEW